MQTKNVICLVLNLIPICISMYCDITIDPQVWLENIRKGGKWSSCSHCEPTYIDVLVFLCKQTYPNLSYSMWRVMFAPKRKTNKKARQRFLHLKLVFIISFPHSFLISFCWQASKHSTIEAYMLSLLIIMSPREEEDTLKKRILIWELNMSEDKIVILVQTHYITSTCIANIFIIPLTYINLCMNKMLNNNFNYM